MIAIIQELFLIWRLLIYSRVSTKRELSGFKALKSNDQFKNFGRVKFN